MSTAAARGDDAIAFYAADIGDTLELAASTVLAQTSDLQGPLKPGRYLIQAINWSDTTVVVWVTVGAWEKGSSLTLTATAGRRRVPLSSGGVVAFETNILKGDSDRLAVITNTGSATVYVTRVSRGA